MLRVAIGSDHSGMELRDKLCQGLRELKYDVVDVGAHEYVRMDDYPDWASIATERVVSGDCDRAILICGSGVGVTIAANKVAGIRACLCHDFYSAAQGVEHDDMNVLCLGQKTVTAETAIELATRFLNARFLAHEERFARRLEKVLRIEQNGTPLDPALYYRPDTGILDFERRRRSKRSSVAP